MRSVRLVANVALALVAVCGIALVQYPTIVYAHAELKASEPAASSVLEQSPDHIRLIFSEAVEVTFGSIRLFDANYKLIPLPTPRHPQGQPTLVQVDVPELEDGSYLVVWRVVSADSHPVQGAFAFQIGTRGVDLRALAADVLSSSNTPISVRGLMALARWLSFLGAMVLVGALLVATRLMGSSRIGVLIRVAWLTAFLGSALVLVAQAPYALGASMSLSDTFGSVDDVLATRLGQWLIVRFIVLVCLIGIVWQLHKHRTLVWRTGAVSLGVLLFATFSIPGHPGTRKFAALSIGNDIVHFASIAVWMGGLVTLVVLGRSWQRESPHVISWFSRVAGTALPVAVVTGVVQAWRMMGGVSKTFETAYGRVLVVKIVVVAVVVVLAARARRLVQAKDKNRLEQQHERFSRTIAVESIVGLVVLAVTAVLVAVPPLVVNSATPFTATLAQSNIIANLTITSARVGTAEMHIVFSPPGGMLEPIESLTARISLPSRDIPAIPIKVRRVGVNHFRATLQLPREGEWLLELLVKSQPNTTLRFTATVPVKP